MKKLQPEDFANTTFDEANRLRRLMLNRYNCNTAIVDEQSAVFLLTEKAWRDIISSADYAFAIDMHRKRLFGIPIRVTHDDEPDTPRIQLLMEPQLSPR